MHHIQLLSQIAHSMYHFITKMKETAMLISLFLLLATSWQSADAKICQKGFVSYNKSCYWFSPKLMLASWAEAQVFCNTMNSYLVIITSRHEDRFIRRRLQQRPLDSVFWIGAHDLLTEGGNLSGCQKDHLKSLTYSNGFPVSFYFVLCFLDSIFWIAGNGLLAEGGNFH
ncbi:uncharacterized protein LOC121373506 isoform X2 [Gigantopelta aegis]|uniref:uncharacterized protein LOC121373506 isoform X2 n=1 Tax=Gigantopelta aegis TaxID=1735272 RepID=UPI001B88C871|nr:uncharacterized protein LOC121373506 isoform X2 [Gigantopelta aegis]